MVMTWVMLLILGYLSFGVFYTLFFSVSALFYKNKSGNDNYPYSKIAVLIPGYKEDTVIASVARHALKNQYPADQFDVVVIADSFQQETLEKLRQLPIILIEVAFENSTKAKALNRAMETLGDTYDIALVLDADNLMHYDVLAKVNNAYCKGKNAIQTQRSAKNKNNGLAVLDGFSERINNHIFRKGPSALGLSSSVIGSGMAFDYKLFKSIMKDIDAVSGFDKPLQLAFVASGNPVYYMEDARVYDEKVSERKVLGNQRKRWLAGQFYNLKSYFGQGLRRLFKGDFNYFNLAVLNNLLLPRVLMLGVLLILSLITLFVLPAYKIYTLSLFLAYILALAIPIPLKAYNKDLLKALINIPFAFITMLKAMFGIKGSNKKFIHTPHTYSSADPEIYEHDEER